MKPTIKWMDNEGNEVEPKEATHVLIAEYDEEGNVIRETFGEVDERRQR